MSLSVMNCLCIQAILPPSSPFGEYSADFTVTCSQSACCGVCDLCVCCRHSLTALKEKVQKLVLLRQQNLKLLRNSSRGQPTFAQSSTWVSCYPVSGVVPELLSRACCFRVRMQCPSSHPHRRDGMLHIPSLEMLSSICNTCLGYSIPLKVLSNILHACAKVSRQFKATLIKLTHAHFLEGMFVILLMQFRHQGL